MIRRSRSSKYSQGLTWQALQDWMSPRNKAVARAPRSLAANSQFFRPRAKGPDGVLGDVVVGLQTSVFQITVEGLPLIEGIVHGFSQGLGRDRLGLEFHNPFEEPVQ